MTDSQALDLSTIARLLTVERRRLVIQLVDGQDTVGFRTLVDEITERRTEQSPGAVERNREYVTLRQEHLPKLDRHDVIEWDGREVAPDTNLDQVVDVLDAVESAMDRRAVADGGRVKDWFECVCGASYRNASAAIRCCSDRFKNELDTPEIMTDGGREQSTAGVTRTLLVGTGLDSTAGHRPDPGSGEPACHKTGDVLAVPTSLARDGVPLCQHHACFGEQPLPGRGPGITDGELLAAFEDALDESECDSVRPEDVAEHVSVTANTVQYRLNGLADDGEVERCWQFGNRPLRAFQMPDDDGAATPEVRLVKEAGD